MNSVNLNCLFKDVIPKYGHILRYRVFRTTAHKVGGEGHDSAHGNISHCFCRSGVSEAVLLPAGSSAKGFSSCSSQMVAEMEPRRLERVRTLHTVSGLCWGCLHED